LLADKEYNYKEELIKNGFTADKIRICDKIYKEVPRANSGEISLFVELPEFNIYAGIDGDCGDRLREVKTGKAFWTQERADENEQITHYALSWYLKNNEIKPFELVSISSLNGKFKIFETHRTKEQLDAWLEKLYQFKKDLIADGFWETKCGFNDRIEI